MSANNVIKRFIAGAVCPRCAEMDKLLMYLNDQDQQVRECVRCNYQDVMTENGPQQISAAEIETRVNQPRPGEESLGHEDEVHIVNILDPKKNKGATRRDH
ncbi:MAG: putative metal-binding protein (TIGR02443 family) [Oceanicoccus sp.]|jgi:uncharacterized metal-binding protein (TIGR02443 family)